MLNRIKRIGQKLSSAERRVADWVLENPNRVVNSTLADIAATANVSEPTVVRFCRSVGTSGFRDFKTRITQDLAASEHMVHADVSDSDDMAQVVAKVIGRSVKELIGVQQRLNIPVFEQVVDALSLAKRIDFYGVGASGLVVADAQNKFFRLGVPCTAYQDAPTILQAASITHQEYVVVLVSKTGHSQIIIDAAQIASEQGATVVAVTSPGSPLAESVPLHLLVDTTEDTGLYTPMSSRLAQLAVLDSLQVALALRLGEKGLQSLDKTKRILNSPRAS